MSKVADYVRTMKAWGTELASGEVRSNAEVRRRLALKWRVSERTAWQYSKEIAARAEIRDGAFLGSTLQMATFIQARRTQREREQIASALALRDLDEIEQALGSTLGAKFRESRVSQMPGFEALFVQRRDAVPSRLHDIDRALRELVNQSDPKQISD